MALPSLTEHQKKRLTQTVLTVADRVLSESDYVALGVEVEEAFGRLSVEIHLEHPERRITLNECADLSRQLEPVIDELAELQAFSYTLDVSSPGLFRQLKTQRELTFYEGKTVTLKPIDVVESKQVYDALPRFQLLQVNNEPVPSSFILRDRDGKTHPMSLGALEKGTGLFLAPPIEWPMDDEMDLEDSALFENEPMESNE
jgi:ribosome maturation factor RimP